MVAHAWRDTDIDILAILEDVDVLRCGKKMWEDMRQSAIESTRLGVVE